MVNKFVVLDRGIPSKRLEANFTWKALKATALVALVSLQVALGTVGSSAVVTDKTYCITSGQVFPKINIIFHIWYNAERFTEACVAPLIKTKGLTFF